MITDFFFKKNIMLKLLIYNANLNKNSNIKSCTVPDNSSYLMGNVECRPYPTHTHQPVCHS